MPEQEEAQDMGNDFARLPDRNWARSQPIQMQADPDRLNESSSTVDIRNTSREQTHIIQDRYRTGHELAPGQLLKNIEMTNHDIEYFLKQRTPNRRDRFGQMLPAHPIVIEGVGNKPQPDQQPNPKPSPQPGEQQPRPAPGHPPPGPNPAPNRRS